MRIQIILFAVLFVVWSASDLPGAGATQRLPMTSAEARTLTEGDNADALHSHVASITLSHDTLTSVTADQHHAEYHTIVSHDTTTTGGQLTSLADGSNVDLLHVHSHDAITTQTADDHHAEYHTIVSHDTETTGGELTALADGSNVDELHLHSHGVISDQTADDHHAEIHVLDSHSDTVTTGGQLDDLTDGGLADGLHSHALIVASDGSPVAAESDVDGNVTFGQNLSVSGLIIPNGFTVGSIPFIGSSGELLESVSRLSWNNASSPQLLIDGGNRGQLRIVSGSTLWDASLLLDNGGGGGEWELIANDNDDFSIANKDQGGLPAISVAKLRDVTMNNSLFVTDYITANGGVHVGGTSDPGSDNLLVDGDATIVGHVSSGAGALFKGDVVVEDGDSVDTILDIYDDGDDGVLRIMQNDIVKVVLHAGDGAFSYVDAGNFGVKDATPSSTFSVSGSQSGSLATYAVDSTLDDGDWTVLIDASSNDVTISLPTAVGIAGRVYNIVVKDETNVADVDPFGSETINDDSDNFVLHLHESLTIQSDGSGWWVL